MKSFFGGKEKVQSVLLMMTDHTWFPTSWGKCQGLGDGLLISHSVLDVTPAPAWSLSRDQHHQALTTRGWYGRGLSCHCPSFPPRMTKWLHNWILRLQLVGWQSLHTRPPWPSKRSWVPQSRNLSCDVVPGTWSTVAQTQDIPDSESAD